MKSAQWMIAIVAASCSAEIPQETERPIPKDGPAALERVFAARVDGTVLVGALDGAFEPDAEVVVRAADGQASSQGVADADGRVTLAPFASTAELVEVDVDGSRVSSFRVRTPARARVTAVHDSIGGAGSVPNDLVISGSSAAPVGLLVRSGDNAVSVIDLETGLEQSFGVRLPEGDVPATPWFAAPIDDIGRRFAVTAFAHDKVYIVNTESASVETTLRVQTPVRLDSELVLPRAIDVDGDGFVEDRITSFRPRSPQGVAVSAGQLYVGFSGFVAPRLGDLPPVYLPAVVAVWRLHDLQAAPRIVALPHLNAQELRPRAGGGILVALTGVLDFVDGQTTSITPGAVALIGPDATVESVVDLGDFAPASAALFDGRVFVSSAVKAHVRVLEGADLIATLELNDEPIDSIFRLAVLAGGLIAAPSFNTDRLHFIDARTLELDPMPFGGPLQVGPGRPAFEGLQIIAARPGRRGVDFVGPDLFAVLGVASRITPIELRKLYGP